MAFIFLQKFRRNLSRETPHDQPQLESQVVLRTGPVVFKKKNLFDRQEVQFIALFCGIFLVSVIALAVLGLLPSELGGQSQGLTIFERLKLFAVDGRPILENSQSLTDANGGQSSGTTDAKNGSAVAFQGDLPTRILISKVGVDVVVRNPQSNNVDLLDTELSRGAVRYPGSGFPAEGNMFLFGHSTTFSHVQNPAYQAFNNIQNLVVGDEITVFSATAKYVYKVRTVERANKDNTWVTFDSSGAMLTLSTCDSFGKKSDRFVVQADFIEKR